MKSKVTENPSLRKALRRAYLSRTEESVRDDWPSKVMRRVREIGPLPIPGFLHDLNRWCGLACERHPGSPWPSSS
jgi:hypothetical protein